VKSSQALDILQTQALVNDEAAELRPSSGMTLAASFVVDNPGQQLREAPNHGA